MLVKILKYKLNKGNKIKVQSHNKRKGKWIKNPNWDWHKKVISGITTIQFGVDRDSIKEYEKELK